MDRKWKVTFQDLFDPVSLSFFKMEIPGLIFQNKKLAQQIYVKIFIQHLVLGFEPTTTSPITTRPDV